MKIIQDANRTARNHVKRTTAIIKRDSKRVAQVLKALTKAGINVTNVNVDSNSYNIYIVGSRADLDIMFGVLRREGLNPASRPKEKESYYTTYWDFPDTKYEYVWVYFSSTSCKRVQVRTELQEVPVYETVCED